jgi:hypothetical protein
MNMLKVNTYSRVPALLLVINGTRLNEIRGAHDSPSISNHLTFDVHSDVNS